MPSDVKNTRLNHRSQPASGQDAAVRTQTGRASTGPGPKLGASPIRWGWWTIGLAISLGMWAALAWVLGWL